MGNNTEIISLFPIPIANIRNYLSDDERVSLSDKVKSFEHRHHSAIDGDAISTHFIKDIKELINYNFLKRLTITINEYANTLGLPQLVIFNMWSNIQNKGSMLKAHAHPNSEVSGALYLNVNQDSSKIYFYNPNPYIQTQFYNSRNIFNYENAWIQPENGQLILFPGWLKHGSDINHMDGRMVISFNAIQTIFDSSSKGFKK